MQKKLTSANKESYSEVPDGSASKESTCNAGDPSLILGLGKSPGEGNGNPLEYSCLENNAEKITNVNK